MDIRGFVAELRRRKVFRVATVYAIAAFAVAQVADILMPGLQLPDWSVTLVLVLPEGGCPGGGFPDAVDSPGGTHRSGASVQ